MNKISVALILLSKKMVNCAEFLSYESIDNFGMACKKYTKEKEVWQSCGKRKMMKIK